MNEAPQFHQILLAAIERADRRHRKETGRSLSLFTIAHEINLDIHTFILVLSGEQMLDIRYLLPLLVYLGCDEKEQRFIFHLAEISQHNNGMLGLLAPHTDEYSVTLFQIRHDTDPEIERITDKRPSA